MFKLLLDCNPVTPWFKLYSEHLIGDWWFNRGSLTKYQDFDFIMRLTPLPRIDYYPKGHFSVHSLNIHYDDLSGIPEEEIKKKMERNRKNVWSELQY